MNCITTVDKFTLPYSGFFKIWKFDRNGNISLCIDKKNTIMYAGADILAKLVGGNSNYKISHLYLGYSLSPPTSQNVDKADPKFPVNDGNGCLRIPIVLPVIFSTDDISYQNNIVLFTCIINNPSIYKMPGSVDLTEDCSFYTAGLVAATIANNILGDRVFAQLYFPSPLAYDPSINLAVTWGVKFTA